MTDENFDELALALGELAASAKPSSFDETTTPRACPVCGEKMELIEQFDITIDVCAQHGVWLDQGELALILERTYWYRREQEDYAIKRDATREIDKTREKFRASLNRVAGLIGI